MQGTVAESELVILLIILHDELNSRLTDVVRTPQSLDGGAGDGAAGVSMNSKSSEDSECVLAMVQEAN